MPDMVERLIAISAARKLLRQAARAYHRAHRASDVHFAQSLHSEGRRYEKAARDLLSVDCHS